MTIALPYFISEGDTQDKDKIQSNFQHLSDKLNNEAFTPASLADASAPNNSIYYSTDASKLVFKDSVGNINNLY